jgi:hypothetical protein
MVEKIGASLAVGVAGLVAGRWSRPAAHKTEQNLSEARDELRSKAAEIGHQAAERVRELAENHRSTSKN